MKEKTKKELREFTINKHIPISISFDIPISGDETVIVRTTGKYPQVMKIWTDKNGSLYYKKEVKK